GVAIVWPGNGADSEWAVLARADELAVNDPLLVEGDVYLVLLESGEILALSTIDPHLGCKVPFVPNFTIMGNTGWFRNPCHGETYDLTGVCYAGPCPRGLDRYEVRVRDGDVEVSFARPIVGADHSVRDGREPVTPN
ncbi:MAG: Rieske (2Fe-2S) protein, partial [Chloroflexi bacterium]|nr:Rieske (2Fe-2S) protein [Chloroflexota bacterium]